MSNDFPNPPVPPPPPSNPPLTGPTGPTPFYQHWVPALTRPNESTYTAIAGAPNASSTQAFIWVFIAALVQSFISFLVGNAAQMQLLRQFGIDQNLPSGLGARGSIVSVICGAPIAAILAVIFFAIFVGVVLLISRAFHGTATFDRLAYAMAAITVPVTLISSVLSLLGGIPFVGLCVGLLSFLLGIYAIVLEIIAVKAVAHIDGLGAAVSVLVLPILAFLCVICALVAGAAALLPVIGNTFSGIGPLPFPTP